MDIPWSKINDYLLAAGSCNTIDTLADLTLQHMAAIIPFDINGLFVTVDPAGKLSSWHAAAPCEEWFHLFNDTYWRALPDMRGQTVLTEEYRWDDCRDPFVTDFLKPQGIRRSIGVFHGGHPGDHAVSFALLRSKKSRPFTETEQMCCRIIQPQLANLFSLLFKLNRNDRECQNYAAMIRDCNQLSRREAEVALLLCWRLNVPEIAVKLSISRRTVEFHIANIYGKFKVRNRRDLILKLNDPRLEAGGNRGNNEPVTIR